MSGNTLSLLNRALQLLGMGLFLVALAYVGVALHKTWTSTAGLADTIWRLNVFGLAGAFLAYWLSVYLQSNAWSFSARRLANDDEHDGKQHLTITYMAAHIYRYLPGNIGHYLARQVLLRTSMVSQGSVALASLNEIISQVLAASLCAALLIPLLANTGLGVFYQSDLVSTLSVGDAVIAVAAIGAITLTLLVWLAPVLRRQLLEWFTVVWARMTAHPSIFVRSVLANIVFLSINGLLFASALLWYSGQTGEFTQVVTVVGLFSLCWLIGFVVPGAPAGLGIRDALLIYLCTTLFHVQGAALLVVGFRLFQIVGDLLLSIVASFLSRTHASAQASIE